MESELEISSHSRCGAFSQCFRAALALKHRRKFFLVLGLLLSLPLLFVDMGAPQTSRCAFLTLLIGIYWITEPIPMATTALFPLLFFPLFGISPAMKVASSYFNDTLFLLLGSLIFAAAIERWDLHKRIAYRFLLLVGSQPRALMLGFMLITCILSMWISNTATTAMMCPLIMAILDELNRQLVENDHSLSQLSTQSTLNERTLLSQGLDETLDASIEIRSDEMRLGEIDNGDSVREDEKGSQLESYYTAMLLGVSYASSLGGVGTLIGTPSNLIFAQQLVILFPNAPEVSFGAWMMVFAPLSIVLVFLTWGLLCGLFVRTANFNINNEIIRRRYENLGSFSWPQFVISVDILLMAVLWLSRTGFTPALPGWSNLFLPKFVTDTTVMMFGVLILFFIPSFKSDDLTMHNPCWDDDMILIVDGDIWKQISWDSVLLLAGGFGLATGIVDSGLAHLIRNKLEVLSFMNLFLLLVIVSGIVLFFTEFTSNTSTITVFAPILGLLAVAIGQDPRLLMVLATVSCSYAFMFPVGTPSNTIVYATGKIKIEHMASAGVIMNTCAAVLLPAYVLLVSPALGIQLGVVPAWANGTNTSLS